MRSLRMKMVMIMVILILALMLTTGAFLMSGVGNFYVSQFYEQMEGTFTPEFIAQLQRLSAEDNAPAQMKELLMAQAGLGIDITGRNVYILDQTGSVLDSSNQRTTVVMTQNILSAMNGEVGQSSSVTNDYMDLAVPVESDGAQYIAYIRDNRATVDALTSELLIIILRALALGLVICVILSFLLSQILITPIRALTVGTKRVAAGDFANRVTVDSRDEIGDLTRNFNHMAKVLQDTISEAENERNKLSTLFLHMTDGVVAFNTAGSVIHYNPAATQMLAQNLSSQTTFDEIFSKEAELDTLLTLRRPQYIEAQKTVGERELELFMAPFSSDHAQGGVLVVIHDVTEQRRSEQLKREFVANVSHELRTPLTNIKSYAETIVDTGDELPPELRSNFMNVIISEADRMTRIVQDLLTLSKIDYGKMEMNISRFPFLKAVQNVYDAAKLNAEQNHHHTMTLTCEGDIPDVNGDRERIEQVITNIVSNAVKYTPDGGKIDMTVGTSYTAVGEALSAGSADIGFISGGNYVLFSDDCDVLLTALRYGINKDSENAADWNDGTLEENTQDMTTYYRSIILAGPSAKGQALLAKVNSGEELTWDDLNGATWSVLAPTSASGYIYPSLWLQEHYGKTIADLDHVVQSDSHSTSLARLATGQADVMVSFGHIRIKNAPNWQEKFGGTAPMVEQTGVIGVTEGIYNDMIAYSKHSDLMADEAFRKALGEAFIEIAQTDEGKQIISVFSQVGYTWGKDSDYDGERDAQAMLKSAGK